MNRVAELRQKRGLSLRGLADIMSKDGLGVVHYTAIRKIERGEQALTLEMMHRFSEALGVALYEIVDEGVGPAPGRYPAVHLPRGAKTAADGITLGYLDPSMFSPRSFLVSGELLEGISDAMPAIRDPENWYVLIDPDGSDLVEGKHYLIMDEAGEHHIRTYRSEPPRFEALAEGSNLRNLHFGKEPIWVIGRVGPSLQMLSFPKQCGAS